MCGIIAVLRRRARREAPNPAELRNAVDAATAALELDDLERTATALENVDRRLRGVPGVRCLLGDHRLSRWIEERLGAAANRLAELESRLDRGEVELPPSRLEALNQALVRCKDAIWSVRKDRLRNARAVAELAGVEDPRTLGEAAITGYLSIQDALSALDRLEVRGRDSAGLAVFVSRCGLDPTDAELAGDLGARDDPLLGSGAVRWFGDTLVVVYKAAAEIGELGDNVRALRAAIAADPLLQRALRAPEAETTVLGHTRWASVGIISEPNTHPLDGEEIDRRGPPVLAALNGDVDNHLSLREKEALRIPEEITTDAKVIPVLVARYLARGLDLEEAFRRTVVQLEGSVAIAACTALHPDRLALALRGSGQALYVGLAEDAFVVASEPYGVVGEAGCYVRMDGETPADPGNPEASRGQIVMLDRAHAGEVEGLRRTAYDGSVIPVTGQDIQRSEITTRDIDRGDHPHYLLKEIAESPRSLRKTLRGKIVERDGRLRVTLGDETLPPALRERLRRRAIARIVVIGQGTAAVAGQGVASAIEEALVGSGVEVTATVATELSGFGLREDMSDTLVVAISQSGTTTDTNRTVDLVRSRGATVIGIVNRRGSDLTEKADGVLYTSDGRDVEMSVASTKAFYSQIAAGFLLAFALAREVGTASVDAEHELLHALRTLPEAMRAVLAQGERIRRCAAEHAPRRRYWAIVGNGRNRIAAAEIRIKLSELCYKSIACDVTEDKKHIDLSSEPLILVCAAGLSGSNADDVAKEVAIYRAHKAAPIVIATRGEERFRAALDVLEVPEVHPSLAFVLSTVAGHLFGYHAALAIDALAQPLRAARGAIEDMLSRGNLGEDPLEGLADRLEDPAHAFLSGLADGVYDGHLEASTASRLASLLRYAMGASPLESFQLEWGRPGTPGVVVEGLIDALTRAIEELTRPVDAIKHQAKTVTVGISRADEALLTVPLVKELLAAGAVRDRLGYGDLRALAALDGVVERVTGFSRYAIEDEDTTGKRRIRIVAKGGLARSLVSRADRGAPLLGTKHQVAEDRQCLVARGARDGRTFVLVPEVEGRRTVALTLLHVELAERAPKATLRGVLSAYRRRLSELQDAVTETQPVFDDALLESFTVLELLTLPIPQLAGRWIGAEVTGAGEPQQEIP